MFNNVSVGKKLAGSFVIVSIIGLVIGLNGIFNLQKIASKDTYLYEKATVPLVDLMVLDAKFNQIQINTYQIYNHAQEKRTDLIQKNLDEIDTAIATGTKAIEHYYTTLLSKEDSSTFTECHSFLAKFVANVDTFKVITRKQGPVNGMTFLRSPEYESVVDTLKQIFDNVTNLKIDAAKAIADNNAKTAKASVLFLTITLIGGTLFLAFLAIFLTLAITKPLKKCVIHMKELESGNLKVKLDIDQKDEIGVMAKAIESFTEKLRKIIREIKDNSKDLAGSSQEMAAVSSQLVAASEEMTVQSSTVSATTEQMSTNINTMASAAEEMSVNTNNVASAAEQMSTNMNAVSGAVEEMSMSIGDISKNSAQAQKVARDANDKASNATSRMDQLGKAAKEIGKVTDVIKRIAEQTNLLALNATIEAASAGEAGKGFAVVANEIKELANQSAQAAGDIAEKIEGVQITTTDAVQVISDVALVIDKITESVQTISAAVEQQTKASNDIANNVTQASSGVRNVSKSISEVAKGANDVARNAGEAAKGSKDVARNITGVSQASKQANTGAKQVDIASKELSRLAGTLNEMVGQFKL